MSDILKTTIDTLARYGFIETLEALRDDLYAEYNYACQKIELCKSVEIEIPTIPVIDKTALTPTGEWLSEIEKTYTITRLSKFLRSVIDQDNYKFLESITKDDLRKIRNIGAGTVNQFIKLRGY